MGAAGAAHSPMMNARRLPPPPRAAPVRARPGAHHHRSTRPAIHSPPRAAPVGLANDAERAAAAAFEGDARAVLVTAAKAKTVDTDTVLGALASLAAAAPTGDGMTEADVASSWDLVYAAPSPLKAWRYIPVPEVWDVAGTAPGSPTALRSIVGPLRFAFRGEIVAPGWDAAAGSLSFVFRSVEVSWGASPTPFFTRALGRKDAKRYTFFGFQRGEGVVCARSSSGMVALLSKAQA